MSAADLGPNWSERPRTDEPDPDLDEIWSSIVEAEPACAAAGELAERTGVPISDLEIAPEAPVRAESPTLLVTPDSVSEVEHSVSVYPTADAAAAGFDAVRESEWLDCLAAVFAEIMRAVVDADSAGLTVTNLGSVLESPELADESLRGRFSLQMDAPDGSSATIEFDVSAIRLGRIVSAVYQYSVAGEIADPHSVVAWAFGKTATAFPNGGMPATPAQETTGAENHQDRLAGRESPFIARRLVEVDGYDYVDADAFDVAYTILMLGSGPNNAIGAVSLHSVVADDPSQNTTRAGAGYREVGFLRLYYFNSALPHGIDQEFADGNCPGELIDRLDVVDTPVFVFDDPSHPDSRYHYCWLEQGIPGVIDGAAREPLERWLGVYLGIPKLGEFETIELAAALTAVEGFGFADFDPTVVSAELASLSGSAYSIHNVVGQDGTFGSIILTEDVDAGRLDQVLDEFGLQGRSEIDLGGHRIRVFDGETVGSTADLYGFAWVDEGHAGALLTNRAALDPAERFLEAFISS